MQKNGGEEGRNKIYQGFCHSLALKKAINKSPFFKESPCLGGPGGHLPKASKISDLPIIQARFYFN
jgi:hypothetical protein